MRPHDDFIPDLPDDLDADDLDDLLMHVAGLRAVALVAGLAVAGLLFGHFWGWL